MIHNTRLRRVAATLHSLPYNAMLRQRLSQPLTSHRAGLPFEVNAFNVAIPVTIHITHNHVIAHAAVAVSTGRRHTLCPQPLGAIPLSAVKEPF